MASFNLIKMEKLLTWLVLNRPNQISKSLSKWVYVFARTWNKTPPKTALETATICESKRILGMLRAWLVVRLSASMCKWHLLIQSLSVRLKISDFVAIQPPKELGLTFNICLFASYQKTTAKTPKCKACQRFPFECFHYTAAAAAAATAEQRVWVNMDEKDYTECATVAVAVSFSIVLCFVLSTLTAMKQPTSVICSFSFFFVWIYRHPHVKSKPHQFLW